MATGVEQPARNARGGTRQRRGEMTPHETTGHEIFVCRHGRTRLNAAGLLRGRLDPDLDAVGRAEGTGLADHLGPEPIARVMSSPLLRAVQTAEAIAARAGVRVETDARLADRDYGGFAGTPRRKSLSRYGDYDSAPGIEKLASLRSRVRAILAELAVAPDAGPVAVVTHDAVVRLPRPGSCARPPVSPVTCVPRPGDASASVTATTAGDSLIAGECRRLRERIGRLRWIRTRGSGRAQSRRDGSATRWVPNTSSNRSRAKLVRSGRPGTRRWDLFPRHHGAPEGRRGRDPRRRAARDRTCG